MNIFILFFFEADFSISLFHIFDPKLDHPHANVINSIKFKSYGLQTSVSRKTAMFYFVRTSYHFFYFQGVYPKLDHPKTIVMNCVYTRINLYPSDRKHNKQIMSVGKQQ